MIMAPKFKKYIVAMDIGTTRLKCFLYSKHMNVIHRTDEKLNLIYSCEGAVEIIPQDLWNSVINNVGKLLSEVNVSPSEIICLAISSQRGTFTLWDRHTDHHLLNLITWKDQRAADESSKWNNSFVIKVIMRLLWALQNTNVLKSAIQNGTAMFGTLDTWLIYRLTKGKSYFTDFSCASATGMYDPFAFSWTWLLKLFGIPSWILPPVCDSVGTHLGNVSADIWGSEIPIMSCIADQSASAFSLGCINRGDVKLTIGTGGFMSNTVGRKIVSHKNDNIYPLIYWKYKDIQTCVLEGAFHNCGTVVDWAYRSAYFDKFEELSVLAESVTDSDGVYLRSGFFNSQMQQRNNLLKSAFVGATVETKNVYIIRAILENIVFQVYRLHISFRKEAYFDERSTIRINGGVSSNDFICQSIADICQASVSRPPCVDGSIRGAALLAGSVAGIFYLNDIDDCDSRIFHPNDQNGQMLRSTYSVWISYQS